MPEDIVNVEGGAIAHGHPIGATGAVLTTRLLHSMKRDGLKRGDRHAVHRRRPGNRARAGTCPDRHELPIVHRLSSRSGSSDMSKDFAQIANDVITGVGLLRQGSPDAMKAFASLSTAGTASNAIDTKTKELMALAIGIAIHCDGCVAYHTKMAHQHGATRQEVARNRRARRLHGRRAGGGVSAAMRCARMTSSADSKRVSDTWLGDDPRSHWPEFLRRRPPHLFFTGKGGVGKTSLACASAVLLGDAGRRVLIVSTDPASNLDAVLDTQLGECPTPITGLPALRR